MAKSDMIEVEGVVVEVPAQHDVPGGHWKWTHDSGAYFRKTQNEFHQDLPGDKVTVEMSPYDLTRGRITWRSK